ncbi:uncharacterized protein BKCO1_900079 [Diplodia corticola]|uniref:Uncharacterized protein n=1 Tax=Diplodia corticola TaxID=236234 RepID=A0A1J9R9D0_9PEZI|nr:uncharacterized protein BKCO1_900079 [Diplodia corticola]OJD36786.1 hypothetical protein BKCO1_900079 [Diplodia corticola]
MEICGITISSQQYDEISSRMGEGFTVDALKHRFRRLKSQSGKAGGATPRKAGTTPKANKTGSTPKASRGRQQKRDVDDDNDDEEQPESPTKKIKHEEKLDDDAGESYFDQPEQV